MVFVCYAKCTTCQKAKAWLAEQHIAADVRDIKLDNPAMSEEEQIALLATDGMLVKRPILVGEDFVLTGFRQKEWEEKLL